MSAPGSLYGEGAQLLESGAASARQTGQQNVEREKIASENIRSATGELGAMGRQLSAQDAAVALKKMEMAENQIEITPQIALGLSKNTGDKEWMTSVGQRMRADVVLGLYTHGLTLQQMKRSPKVTQVYDDKGKIRHAVVYTDEQGTLQQLMLDAGMTPEKLHPPKPGAGGGDDFKKNKEFIKSHEKAAALFNDPFKSKQLKSTDPDQWNRAHEEYIKDQDRYDQLKTSMGGAGSAQPSGDGETPAPDNTPFDADAFIKDALGQ